MFASRHTAEFSLGRVTAPRHATALTTWVRLAMVARSQRRALARLDTAALADIGVTQRQALGEAQRPVWDVPSSWLR